MKVFSFFLFLPFFIRAQSVITQDNSSKLNLRDTIMRVFEKNSNETDYEYNENYDKLQHKIAYLKIGNIIELNKKNAVIIYTSSDSSITAELFSFKDKKWIQMDKKELDIDWLVFYVKFDDYNFDGFNDIYINVAVSNGLGLSRGHLLTTLNDKFIQHPETRNIADMYPNKTKKVIEAKYPLYCKDSKTAFNSEYKWINNKLTLQGKLRTCK